MDLAINSATNASLNHFHTAAARPMCCVKPCMQTRVCKAEYYSMTHVIDYLCADVSIKIAYCRMPHILGFVCRGMQARQRTAVCLISQIICMQKRACKAAYCSVSHVTSYLRAQSCTQGSVLQHNPCVHSNVQMFLCKAAFYPLGTSFPPLPLRAVCLLMAMGV